MRGVVAVLLLVSLASCDANPGDSRLGARCSAWIILHGAADLRLDCPQPQPAKPVTPPPATQPAKPVRK